MIRNIGWEDLSACRVLVVLVSADESTLLAQINMVRVSQPLISLLPAATELVMEPPKALSLVDVKSNARSNVRLKFFSDGEPTDEPIPESTGDDARWSWSLANNVSSNSLADLRRVAGRDPRAPENVCSKSAITSAAASLPLYSQLAKDDRV